MRTRRATKRTRYRVFDGKHSVELKLRTPHQLFDERDPAPFRERDLDDDAAKYILGSFRDLKGQGEVRLSLYFETLGTFRERPKDISDAIHAFFKFEGESKRRELRETFRLGLVSLAIGLTFLFTCTTLGAHAHDLESYIGESSLLAMLKEGLAIMGWVAMWRPISVFLYEWWPIRDAMKDYELLGEIEVEVHPQELSSYRANEEGRATAVENREQLMQWKLGTLGRPWKRETSTVS